MSPWSSVPDVWLRFRWACEPSFNAGPYDYEPSTGELARMLRERLISASFSVVAWPIRTPRRWLLRRNVDALRADMQKVYAPESRERFEEWATHGLVRDGYAWGQHQRGVS